jgi:hypothetical protein
MSSTDIETLVPSLYQCVETRIIEVFCLLSQPLPHLRFNLIVISQTFSTQLWTALRDKHFYRKRETFLYEYPLHWVFAHRKHTTERSSSAVDILTTETSLWIFACASATSIFLWEKIIINTKRRRQCPSGCYLDCHEAGLCCYLVIHMENYYVHYNCFTPICDLFTDSYFIWMSH